jgi:hypothetical protein
VRTLCLGHRCGRTIRNLIIDISGMIRNVSGDYKVPCIGVLIKEQKKDLIRSYNKDKQKSGPYRSVIYLI